MLLSIVSGGLSQEEPSVVYEYILSSLTEQREGHSGAKHHSEEFKRQVVEHYQSDEALTLAQCAQLYGISDKTLSAWQLELQKKAT